MKYFQAPLSQNYLAPKSDSRTSPVRTDADARWGQAGRSLWRVALACLPCAGPSAAAVGNRIDQALIRRSFQQLAFQHFPSGGRILLPASSFLLRGRNNCFRQAKFCFGKQTLASASKYCFGHAIFCFWQT